MALRPTTAYAFRDEERAVRRRFVPVAALAVSARSLSARFTDSLSGNRLTRSGAISSSPRDPRVPGYARSESALEILAAMNWDRDHLAFAGLGVDVVAPLDPPQEPTVSSRRHISAPVTAFTRRLPISERWIRAVALAPAEPRELR